MSQSSDSSHMLAQREHLAHPQGLEGDPRLHEARSTATRPMTETELARATIRASDAEAECAGERQLLAVDPGIVDGLPSELLVAIFTALFDSTDWKDIAEAAYSFEHRWVPYQLAAVCRRWRNLALALPELWTYIATPPARSPQRLRFQESVQLNLERSHPRPLQLVLIYNVSTQTMLARPEFAWFVDLLHTLAPSVPRWSRLKIVFPPQMRARWFEEWMSQRQTPLLNEVFLGTVPFYHNQPDFDVLQIPWAYSAPNLRRLCASDIALYLPSALSCIRNLHIDVTEEHGYEPVALVLMQLPGLQHLLLRFKRGPSPLDRVPPPVELPWLLSFTVRGRDNDFDDLDYETPAARFISARNLQTLNIRPYDARKDDVSWGRLYAEVYHDITDLDLFGGGRLLAAHGVSFGSLARLKRLTIRRCRFPKDGGERFWTALAALADTSPLWPQLECIALHGCGEREGADSLLRDLATLVRARRGGGGLVGTRLRLSFINWLGEPFPSDDWLALCRTLGPGNVHLEAAGGKVQSLSPDDVEYLGSQGI